LDAKISSAKDLDFLIAGVAEEIIEIEKGTQERSSEELEQEPSRHSCACQIGASCQSIIGLN